MAKKIIFTLTAAILFFSIIPSVSFAVVQDDNILQVGDEDEAVERLQEKLQEQDYLHGDVTGYFGRNTQNAIIKFQQENGLISDGKAGPDTMKILYGIIDEEEGVQEGLENSNASDDSSGMAGSFHPGDKGNAINAIQERLKELECYDYANITGYYGPVTENAVRKFQRTHGIDASGVLNEETNAMLFSEDAQHYEICLGDSGEDVVKIQNKLKQLGYLDSDATGYYSYLTTTAMRMFQDKNNLTIDGRSSLETRNLLFSDNAKAYNKATDDIKRTVLLSENALYGISGMIEIAKEQEGKQYSYGSCGPNSYDCAGFVYYVLKNAGVATSRLSVASYATLSNWDTIDDINSLAVGDLVFFKSDNDSSINHMGIYLGGGSFIHALPSAESVKVSGMSSDYYFNNFVTAKRIF